MNDTHARGARTRVALLALFALSGFAGLIYESIWSHYLKLFLGHAAYAQTLVLSIFMGGMAFGSWLAARLGVRWRNLLRGYAATEIVLGLAGIIFHPAFDAGMQHAYETVLPALGSPSAVQTFKWSVAALAITPQSILLGMTFPLMTGALLRRFPARSGDSVAALYFTNSLGAAIGVLASGFVLIPAVGLPGTVLGAGLLNVLLGAAVWLMAGRPAWQEAPAPVPAARSAGAARAPVTLLLVAALVTGTASFMYEVGWLRLLALVLGASTHAFELMLSAFILGLAIGSLWIRRRIDGLERPLVTLGVIQVAMGILAVAPLFAVNGIFELMAFAMHALARSDQGYVGLNLANHAIAMAVMLPATVCAGMTLPLITHALVRAGYGERSVGQVYAANTLGAILGVQLAIHLVMPEVGLKGLMVLGAALDVALGCVLLVRYAGGPLRPILASAGIAAIAVTVLGARLDPRLLASGVFRHGDPRSLRHAEILFHRDGKTATVSLVGYPRGVFGLQTNGKTDATVEMGDGEPTHDEYTMVLVGALPLGVRPEARRAAIIGFGAGLTTHVLLASDTIEQVDTIEIEPFMYEAARGFVPRVRRAFDDPRAAVRFEDARTWFATRGGRYDLIVSEPSHPWVSGVASLYTVEFYRFARRHLGEDGLFAQWLHTRAMSPALVSSVLRALGESFPDYVVYDLNGGDLLLLAGRSGSLALDPQVLLANPSMAAELTRIGVHDPQDLHARFVGNRALLDGMMGTYGMPANSDYFPVLDLGAVRARFLRDGLEDILALPRARLPIVEMLVAPDPGWDRTRVTAAADIPQLNAAATAMVIRDRLGGAGQQLDGPPLPVDVRDTIALAALLWADCGEGREDVWVDSVQDVAALTVSVLRPTELDAIWDRAQPPGCAERWSDRQQAWMALVRALSARDGAAMVRPALALLRAMAAAPRTAPDAPHREFIAGAAMLGLLTTGQRASARQVWTHELEDVSTGGTPRVETRVLEALTRAGAGAPEPSINR